MGWHRENVLPIIMEEYNKHVENDDVSVSSELFIMAVMLIQEQEDIIKRLLYVQALAVEIDHISEEDYEG